MKLTFRLSPLASTLGVLDLKSGVVVALLFALLNKVAGVYGLIAVATGAGGSFAQLSLYLYSVVALVALAWGLKAVKQEDAKHTLYFAHLYSADHIFSTSWTIYFAVIWWFRTPHDGRQQVNSDAQLEIIRMTPVYNQTYTEQERLEAAAAIWNAEKGKAFAIILLSWLSKFYFALLLYSYATHLRKGSYRALPLSRSSSAPTSSAAAAYDTSLGLMPEDDDVEDFYRTPIRSGNSNATSSSHAPGSSISSFADFVNAPGRSRKGKGVPSTTGEEDSEALFDEDEQVAFHSSSRARTDESSVSSVDDDRRTTERTVRAGRGW